MSCHLPQVIDNKQRMLRDELDNQMSVSSAISASADNAAKTLKVHCVLSTDTVLLVHYLLVFALYMFCTRTFTHFLLV